MGATGQQSRSEESASPKTCLDEIAEMVLGLRSSPHRDTYDPAELVYRVRELVAAQPQPVVPGPLPTGELEPGVRIWKSACGDLTVTSVTDFVGNTLWRNHSKALSATWPSKPVRKDLFVECQIVVPPIKEPEPIPPKPTLVLARPKPEFCGSNDYEWEWFKLLSDGAWSSDNNCLAAVHMDAHPTCDDPEHLAGLEVLKRQQGGA